MQTVLLRAFNTYALDRYEVSARRGVLRPARRDFFSIFLKNGVISLSAEWRQTIVPCQRDEEDGSQKEALPQSSLGAGCGSSCMLIYAIIICLLREEE